jgi:hypothetical protein
VGTDKFPLEPLTGFLYNITWINSKQLEDFSRPTWVPPASRSRGHEVYFFFLCHRKTTRVQFSSSETADAGVPWASGAAGTPGGWPLEAGTAGFTSAVLKCLFRRSMDTETSLVPICKKKTFLFLAPTATCPSYSCANKGRLPSFRR